MACRRRSKADKYNTAAMATTALLLGQLVCDTKVDLSNGDCRTFLCYVFAITGERLHTAGLCLI